MLHGAAGTGWSTATLQITSSEGALCVNAFTDSGRSFPADPSDVLPLLAEVGRQEPGFVDDRVRSLELVLDHTGAFEFTGGDVDSISPGRVVLDPACRLPNHPLPGMTFPPGARKTDEPTDPAVLAEVSGLINEFIERYHAIAGEPPRLESGYSESEIVAAERELGIRLPEDLRALYRTVRGDEAESGLLGRYSPYPLDRLLSDYRDGDPGSLGWDDDPFHQGVVFDTDPPGLVKRLSRSDWWITFAPNHAGNFLMIDLDPAGDGQVGQVIEAGRDFHRAVRYVSTSVTSMLKQVVEGLRAGRYTYQNGYLRAATEFDRNTAPPPDQAQVLYLNDGGDVDFGTLADLPHLRALSVNRAGSVLPRVAGLSALESLSVDAEQVELELLAHHPTLWSLTLSGITEPLDLGVLSTLPALCRLDVSGVELVDIAQVAGLAGLRVVTLNKEQWGNLRDAGADLPVLAAAQLVGTSSLDEVADWVGSLSGTRPETRKISGRI